MDSSAMVVVRRNNALGEECLDEFKARESGRIGYLIC